MIHTGVLPFPASIFFQPGRKSHELCRAVLQPGREAVTMCHWKSLKVTKWVIGKYLPHDYCGATPQAKTHKLVWLVFWDVGQHHKHLDLFFSLGRYRTHNFLNTRFQVDISFKGGLILLVEVTSTSPASLVFRRPWLYCHPHNATRQIPKAVDTRSLGLYQGQSHSMSAGILTADDSFSEFSFVPECMSFPKWSN